MKDYIENLKEIPARLCGTCYQNSSLCLFCQNNIEEYIKKPMYIWDDLPENCNFRGWIFLKQEEVKQKIRRKKEKILSIKIKLKFSDGIKKKRLLKEMEKYQKEVDSYKNFGSEKW